MELIELANMTELPIIIVMLYIGMRVFEWVIKAMLDDNGGDANVYFVASNGTSWWYTALTKAT